MTSPTEDGILLRLDKYLSDSGKYTRSESSRLIRQGKVTADGVVIRDPAIKVDESTVQAPENRRRTGAPAAENGVM